MDPDDEPPGHHVSAHFDYASPLSEEAKTAGRLALDFVRAAYGRSSDPTTFDEIRMSQLMTDAKSTPAMALHVIASMSEIASILVGTTVSIAGSDPDEELVAGAAEALFETLSVQMQMRWDEQ